MIIYIIVCALIIFIYLILIKQVYDRKPEKIVNKHVVITGGTSGIGKALAVIAAKQGAHITIIARNLERLESTEKELRSVCLNKTQKIQSFSIDVSDYSAIENTLHEIDEHVAPIFMLVNCAGLAICGKLESMNLEDIQTMTNINFLGTLYPTKAIVPKMKARREGIIIITASQAALLGIFGYTVYTSTKFALRGLAESLYMEVKPYNMSVTLSLPPDTDTPGFENENKSKPKETKLISASSGLFRPEEVAIKMLRDALYKNFFSTVGFEGFLLTTLCIGFTPFSSYLEVLYQSMLLGPFRIISCFILCSFHRIIKKCHNDENKSK